MFDVLLTLDRFDRGIMLLEINEHFYAVAFGKSLHKPFAMLECSSNEIVRDAIAFEKISSR
jgi:hypothetical protein